MNNWRQVVLQIQVFSHLRSSKPQIKNEWILVMEAIVIFSLCLITMVGSRKRHSFFVDWNVLQVQNKGTKLKASESRKSFRVNAPRMCSPLYSAWESNLSGTFALAMDYWWKRGNWKKKKKNDSSRVGKMPTKWTK